MISFNRFVTINPEVRNAIEQALGLIGRPGIGNIWDHSTLNNNLPEVAERLIDLQKEIRLQLIQIAGPYCTYCHKRFQNENRAVVDHFVLKSVKRGLAKFTYESLNFLLSCADCNNEKGQKKTFQTTAGRAGAELYRDVVFTHFHPNLHRYQDFFEIRESVVIARRKEGVNYLKMIGYMEPHQQEQIMCLYHLRNSQTTSTEIEDHVEMLISRPRFRSGPV